ncbi:MAG: hypothetical protein NDJ89_13490 [Oligoflexia bacterium]|nr:hypothetical protein [Oligoflexia bacterium]
MGKTLASYGFLIIPGLILSATTFAAEDAQKVSVAEKKGGLKLVTQTIQPKPAEISDAYKIQYVVQQMGGNATESVSEFNGPILLDHYDDPSNIPIVEMKIGGVKKLLVRLPRSIPGAGLKKDQLILIQPQNLTYIDKSVKYTVLDSYMNILNPYRKIALESCSMTGSVEMAAVKSVFPEISKEIVAYVEVDRAQFDKSVRDYARRNNAEQLCDQPERTPFAKAGTILKEEYMVSENYVKPEFQIQRLEEPAQVQVSSRAGK